MTNKNNTKLASKWIKDSDAILITASNGFSISEGLNLFTNDSKIKEILRLLFNKYHFPNILSAFQFPYKNSLDYWRVIARIVEYYGNDYKPTELMTDLKKIINNKPYFIWTSNAEHHFSMAGFDNVFEIEGNWFDGVCSIHPQSHGIYHLSSQLHKIFQKDLAGNLTKDDLPRCTTCGAELKLNLAGNNFHPNSQQLTAFRNFITNYKSKKLVILELGIGPQNQLIKMPSLQLIEANSQSRYITVNKGQLFIPDEIKEQSVGYSSTIIDALKELKSGKSFGAKTIGPERKNTLKGEKFMQKFYPYFMIDSEFQPGSRPLYMTLDKFHSSHLHAVQYGRPFMWDLGDSAIIHCFTPSGQYYKIHLGLDENQNEVHGFYIDSGTFIAIESANNTGAGFSQINTEIPVNGNNEILLPRKETLIQLFPNQRKIIEKFIIDSI